MKVWKKIAAIVSMAAVCCAMLVPTSANAASSGCAIHNYVTQKNYSHYQVVGLQYDMHISGFHTALDETQTPITSYCNMDLVHCYHDAICSGCGDKKERVEITEKVLHKNCELRKQGVIGKQF